MLCVSLQSTLEVEASGDMQWVARKNTFCPQEYVASLIGLYKNDGAVLYVDNIGLYK